MYSKFSFGEVYCRIYSRKFSFMALREQSGKHDFGTYIRQYIQMQKAARHPTICDIINDVRLFLDILLQIFDVI